MSSEDRLLAYSILPLPETEMPDCWKQDDRMNALFADFRNQSVNPQDWSSKYKFWHEIIFKLLHFNKCCIFSISDLNIAFRRNCRIPTCLSTVIQEMQRNREIVPEEDFLRESSYTWSSWVVDLFLKKPLVWSFSKVKKYVFEEMIDVHRKYVHLPTVKELGEIILSTIDSSRENTLFPLSEIIDNCIEKTKNTLINERNIRLALIYLMHTKKAALKGDCYDIESDSLFKICRHGVKSVTEVEEGIYKLKNQENQLIRTIDQLESMKHICMEKAKSYVASEFRDAAKNCLRKKHELDKCIEKRAASLRNVQTLLSKIKDARSDLEVLDAYKVGHNILKQFEQTGLTEDNVRETIDDLSEALENMNDLQTALTEPALHSESDWELEKELQESINFTLNEDANEKILGTEKSIPRSLSMKGVPDLSSLQLQDLPVPKKPTEPTMFMPAI